MPKTKIQYKVQSKVGKAIKKYGLLEAGDKILVGISGGKDSLVLLDSLAAICRRLPFEVKLQAVHIYARNIGYEIDTQGIEQLCASLNVPFVVKTIEVDFSVKSNKSTCFICSWSRRKTLFETAKELNCNKLALGHHLDDVVETLLMNMSFQGSYSTMPPLTTMQKWDYKIIRPLYLVHESESAEYASSSGFVRVKKLCPYETESNRSEIKNIVKQLEALFPHAKSNILNAMTNIMPEYLPGKE